MAIDARANARGTTPRLPRPQGSTPPSWHRARTLPGQNLRSRQGDGIPLANPPTPDDRGINPDVPAVRHDCGAQDSRVLGQAALAQRRHDAAGTGPVDPQSHVAQLDRPPDPLVLDEPVRVAPRFDHEVRSEPRDLETACRGQGPQ